MKKYLLALILCCIFSAHIASAAQFISIGTGSTGGTYFPVGAAMANIWRKDIDGLKSNAQSTGGTVNNIQLLERGEVEIGFLDALYHDAYNGTGLYKGQKKDFLRGMVVIYYDLVHIMVADNSDIKSIADLKGKRVSVGPVGGSIPVLSEAILKEAGIDMRKDIQAEYLGHAEMAAAFADKNIDAAFAIGSPGIASVIELTTLGTAKLISIDPPLLERILQNYSFFLPTTIEADFYKGQENPIHTVRLSNIIAVHEKVSDDLVYAITKLLFENKQTLTSVAASMEDMNPEDIKNITIPLHKGALRYYKEKGILTE